MQMSIQEQLNQQQLFTSRRVLARLLGCTDFWVYYKGIGSRRFCSACAQQTYPPQDFRIDSLSPCSCFSGKPFKALYGDGSMSDDDELNRSDDHEHTR